MKCQLCNEKATRIANLEKHPVNWDGAKPDYARTGIIVMCAAHTRANTFNQTLVWERLDQVEEVPEMVYKIIWFAKDGSVLGETLVDDADGRDEYIQETTEGLDAPDGWDTYQVEEVA